MATVHLIHPEQSRRSVYHPALLSAGWVVSEAHGRNDTLSRLASPLGQRFGDLVLIDLQDWTVPGTALIRALRRQVASPLPIVVRLPLGEDGLGLAADAARRAGANLVLDAALGAAEVATAADRVCGRASPHASPHPGLSELWQQQCELLAVPDAAAATTVAARRVFEGLLALRLDERAADAAMALAGLEGGPRPLARWAGWFHPAHANATDLATFEQRRLSTVPLCLVFDAGGQRYALPMEGEVTPSAWWCDEHPAPGEAEAGVSALPLVRLLGSSGFRRLLITDRATIVLRDHHRPGVAPQALRVDEVLGLENLALDACPPQLARASGCLGSARDRDGEPVLVLDGAHLQRTLHSVVSTDLARFG